MLEAQGKAQALFAAIESHNLIRPGVAETEINEDIYALAHKMYGITRYWHKRIVRAGQNTLAPYDENPPDLTLGEGVLTLWYDTYVHLDDMRGATGRESERGDGLDATIASLAARLTTRGWGPATLVLDGVGRHQVGAGGPEITGDALQFALVATGRADAATMGLDADVNIY